jgi:hypothetical protein
MRNVQMYQAPSSSKRTVYTHVLHTSNIWGITIVSQNDAKPSGVNDGSYLLISVRASLKVDGVSTLPEKQKKSMTDLL